MSSKFINQLTFFRKICICILVFSGGKDAILLDIEWPVSYPNVLPIISLDAFFNRSILPEVKIEVIQVSAFLVR